jgi:hypothetical protein
VDIKSLNMEATALTNSMEEKDMEEVFRVQWNTVQKNCLELIRDITTSLSTIDLMRWWDTYDVYFKLLWKILIFYFF